MTGTTTQDQVNEITIVTDKSIFDMKPGEMMKIESRWLLRCPDGCGGHSDITTWNITENEDGTITVSPSILARKCGAHYFIENSKIRYV